MRVALVPAYRRADTIVATVTAVAPLVDRVVVVDDGSGDGTGAAARAAGADLVTLTLNRGKAAALAAGVGVSPEASVYLLVDADTGRSAAAVAPLLAEVAAGRADLAVGVLPPAGSRGGWGRVRRLARWGIERACGLRTEAPLSGQRAVRADLLRSLLPLGRRFGVEAAMTVDAVRAGARLVEVAVAVEHRHTGRTVAGVLHRGRQGVDLVRALWPRLTSRRARLALLAVAAAVAATALVLGGAVSAPDPGRPLPRAERFVVVATPSWSWSEARQVPALDAVARGGGLVANASTVTPGPPSAHAAWATAGAGARMGGLGGRPVPPPPGDRPLLVTAMGPAATAQQGEARPSHPGHLGDALARAGVPTALVGPPGTPLGLLAADSSGRTTYAATATTGRPADPLLAALGRGARFAAVDATGLDAAGLDGLLGRLLAPGGGTVVAVVPEPPPAGDHRLQPWFLAGPGLPAGTLASPSTGRHALVSLTDLAPTALDVLGVPVPSGMTGRALRAAPGPADTSALSRSVRDSRIRAAVWAPATATVTTVAVLAGLAGFVPALRRRRLVHAAALGTAAWPVATYLVDAVPRVSALGAAGVGALGGAAAAAVAVASLRATATRLAPLSWVAGLTLAVVAADLATGGHLQLDSPLGVSAATSGRFSGLPNVGFAVLAAATCVLAAGHLRHAPRRDEALWAVAALFALAVLVDGAPTLGADLGGVVTLVPVLGLAWVRVRTGRLRPAHAMVAAAGAAGAALAVAGADLARPGGARTHLGRALSGEVDLGAALARRLDANLATYTTVWQPAAVVLAGALVVVLASGRWRGVLPPAGDDRPLVAALVAAGLVGNVVNDSGAVVTALPFLFLVPWVLALAAEREEPRIVVDAAVRA